jgi:tRNA threonylcarbamoyl adenosine modification protein YeaZ
MILFIDTTQKKCNFGLYKKDKFIKTFSIDTNNNLTDIAVEYLDKLLTSAKIKKTEIKKIYLTIGPGSFTGVRVGILIAKSFALITKTQIYTIDSLLLQLPKGNGISIIDARNKNYIAVYKNSKVVLKPELVTYEQTKEIIKKYKKEQVFNNYEKVDIFLNFLIHFKNFKLNKNIDALYIKPAL